MTRVHLDFETRSLLSVVDVGSCVYAAHESTAILCAAFAIDDEPVEQFTRPQLLDTFSHYEAHEIPPAIIRLAMLAAEEDVLFVAHNAFFEQNVWIEKMVKRHGFPPIHPRRWRCTAAKAAARALPRKLEKVAKVLHLPMQKDMEGNRVMQKLSRPRRITKNNNSQWWTPEDAPEDFEILYSYNKSDVEVERHVDHALPDLSDKEQKLWFLDQRINFEGVQIDVAFVEKAVQYRDRYVEDLKTEFTQLTRGYASPTQVARMGEWVEGQGVDMPNCQASTIDQKLNAHYIGSELLPEQVVRAFQIRREISKTSTAKYDAMLSRVDKSGRLRDILLYHAASTGRWGGRGAQLQNLPRPKCDVWNLVRDIMRSDYETFVFLYNDLMDALSSGTRGAIVAAEGHDLIVADFSAIEARVLAWLSGQEDVLSLFANGLDVYSHQATSIYGRPIDREVDKSEGMVGKVSILALGYQGGIGAFGQMAKGYGLDLIPLYDTIWGIATPDERQKAKKAYHGYLARTDEPMHELAALAADVIKQRWRKANDKTVSYWYKVEEAAIEAVRTGQLVKCGHVHWGLQGKGYEQFLLCRLPSGRKLSYHRPELRESTTPWGKKKPTLTYMGEDSTTKQYLRHTAYGGLLAENITQAVARDIMAEGLLRVDEHGYTPKLSVHDEGISEVPEDFGTLDEYETLMSQQPAWAPGLPITAKGWRGKRYKK